MVALEVARLETTDSKLFGFLPTTSQRLVTLARLGQVELDLVDRPGSAGGPAWRITRVVVGAIAVGG